MQGDPGGSQGYTGSAGYIGHDGYTGSIGYVGSQGIGYTGSMPNAVFQNTVPAPLVAGELWFDTDDGLMSAYFPDQNVWLGINGGTAGYTGSLGFFDPNKTLLFSNTVTFAQNAVVNNAFVATSLDMINYSEAVVNYGTVTTSPKTLYLANGNIQFITLGISTLTLSFANTGMKDNRGYNLVLFVTQDGNGNRTLAYGADTVIKWPSGVAPTLSIGANATDVLTFYTANKGASWFGTLSGKNYF